MLCPPMLRGVIICPSDKFKKLLFADKSLEGVSVWRLGAGAGAGVLVLSNVFEVVAPLYVSFFLGLAGISVRHIVLVGGSSSPRPDLNTFES